MLASKAMRRLSLNQIKRRLLTMFLLAMNLHCQCTSIFAGIQYKYMTATIIFSERTICRGYLEAEATATSICYCNASFLFATINASLLCTEAYTSSAPGL
uniref:Putative secreted protein n=1 Tax=Amblyomma cajennense TaxID=34607 RepID=A0A023FBK0_AMBCJ